MSHAEPTTTPAPGSSESAPVEAATRAHVPTIVIEPGRRWSLGLGGLWEFRELLMFLTWRDIKVRYKQTFFGAGWAILQPIMLMIVFGLFFGRLAGLPSEGLPYAVFALSGLVPWTFFSNSLTALAQSVVSSSRLVTKVYFPRLVVPFAAAGSYIVDLVIALCVLLVLQAFYGIYPTYRIVFVPFLAIFALTAAFSIGIWLAALNVRYRDVAYVLPFFVQVLMFISPVAYSTTLVPARWRALYGLNPMVGVLEGFRWSVSGASTRPGPLVALSVVVTLLLLVGGLLYFAQTEQSFADVI